jgi:hypothetical protein
LYHMSDCLRPSYTAYASGLPPKHVERIRKWYKKGLRSVHAKAGRWLNEAVVAEARSGDQVFDVGTSCGIHGILTTRT